MKRRFLLFALAAFTALTSQGQSSDRFRNTTRRPYPDRSRCNANSSYGNQSPYYQAMPNEAFRLALQQLAQTSFDSDKLRLAKYIAGTSYLQTEQIEALANQLSFSSSRRELLIAAYPTCLDPQLYFLAINALPFSSDRNQVWDAVDQWRSAPQNQLVRNGNW